MLRYAITAPLSADNPEAWRTNLLASARRWADEGIDFVQLREKSLDAGALHALAETLQQILRGSRTRLLINHRADIAATLNAGVHLTARPGELTPTQVRTLYTAADIAEPLISVSCHTLEEVHRTRTEHPSLILFGPVFEKRIGSELITPGSGLQALSAAAQAAGEIPVLALGGLTPENTPACLDSGAKGIAAIRLFADKS